MEQTESAKKPKKHANMLVICKQKSKIRDLVSESALKLTQTLQNPQNDKENSVFVLGRSETISKAITVVEILKR